MFALISLANKSTTMRALLDAPEIQLAIDGVMQALVTDEDEIV